MLDTILIWIGKQALAYAVGILFKRLHPQEAESHILSVIANAKPFPPDTTPAEARNPNTSDHG